MKIELDKHDEQRLTVRFPYDAFIVEAIRSIPGRSWNPELRVWLIPYTLRALELFKERFSRGDVEIEAELLDECNTLLEWEQMES